MRSWLECIPVVIAGFFSATALEGASANPALNRGMCEEENTAGHGYVCYQPGTRILLEQGGFVEIETQAVEGRPKRVRFHFSGANSAAVPTGENAEPVQVRQYTESEFAGKLHKVFRGVSYPMLYPGIDALFHFDNESLGLDLVLHEGANLDAVRLDYSSRKIRVNSNGDLEVGEAPSLLQKRPRIHFMRNGAGAVASVDYSIAADGLVHLQTNSQATDAVPTPARVSVGNGVSSGSTVDLAVALGGGGFDAAYAFAVDSSGAIYVAGETGSLSLSGSGRRPSRDAFVAKLNSTATTVLWLTVIGGAGDDAAFAIAVDASGYVYFTGSTSSTDFPTTAGAISRTNSGVQNAFAVKLNPSGVVVYSTLLGSAGSDQGLGIAVDGSGFVYIAGQTSASFPTTSGAFQPYFGGGTDCFVSKLNLSSGTLVYSTLLGGSGFDGCKAITVDSSGYAYLAGYTYSTNFPLQKAIQGAASGGGDAFVAKLNPAGVALVYATYLGGSSYDEATAISVDSAGAVYVAGSTLSWNFPTTAGAFQTSSHGGYDTFIAKIAANGTSFGYVTLLGGSGSDAATAIAVDSNGRAVVAGYTSSIDFPVARPTQSTLAGGFDTFTAVLDSTGSSVLFCTYLGGSADDRAFGVAVAGNTIYLSGYTQSTDFPITTGAAPVSTDTQLFIARLTYTLPPISGLVYVPISACRVADTRSSSTFTGAFGPPYIPADSSRDFPLASGACGIPSTVGAYSLTVTAVPRGSQMRWLSLWPAGQSQPGVSTLNSYDGRVASNFAIVPAGSASGRPISVYARDATDVIIDVTGYFADPSVAPSGLVFNPLTPCRAADTRYASYPTGLGTPYVAAGAVRMLPVMQSPCTSLISPLVYSFNTAVVPKSALQSVVLWPLGQPQPPVAITLGSPNGQVVSTAALVPAGTAGSLNVIASDNTEIILDLNGYFSVQGTAGALSFIPLTPCRAADTRFGSIMATEETRTFDIVGSGCNVPSTVKAYSANISVVPPNAPARWITAYPTGQSPPATATVTSYNGAIVANATLVPAGTAGKIDIFARDPVHVIIDINGYFIP